LCAAVEPSCPLSAGPGILGRLGRAIMPTGPRGERRPADVIGCAVQMVRLSVGDEIEELKQPFGRVRSGHAGANARAAKLTPKKREQIAKKAAAARWG
jgi:hypothetical protein